MCIIGSGAGGGMLAEGLAQAGFDVVMLEAESIEPKKTSTWMKGLPCSAYQEGGLRATDDLDTIYRVSVGGTTTINWTTCSNP